MHKVNTADLDELHWRSPKGTFEGYGKQISEALGRERYSTDLMRRHPFDVELCRMPPGAKPFPYHAHSAQFEFYLAVSGSATIRHEGGTTAVIAGDAFLFKPGEAHQLINEGVEDFVYLCVADNPLGESWHYPDSGKCGVSLPERRFVGADPLDYYAGEE